MKRRHRPGLLAFGLLAATLPHAAFAHHCGNPIDCFGGERSAIPAVTGLLLLSVASFALDLSPLGTVKGIVESITGRDLLTGEKLATWERAIGWIPIVGRAGDVAGLGGDVARIGDDLSGMVRVGDDLGGASRVGDDVVGVARADDVGVVTPHRPPGGGSSGGGSGIASAPASSPVQINMRHLFHGEINEKGKPVGFHHRGSIGSSYFARVVPGTETPPNAHGVYRAKVEIRDPNTGAWKQKGVPSTFFPDSWSRIRVIEEIRGAYANQIPTSGGAPANYWEGISPSGIRIGGYLDATGRINTAFPIL